MSFNIVDRVGSSFSVMGGGGLKFDKKILYKGRGARPRGEFLISKGFLMQFTAYWALFLTQYVTKS